MAEIRSYSKTGALICPLCVGKGSPVYRYDVVHTGTVEEMRALWPTYEDQQRIRGADGHKPAGFQLHITPEEGAALALAEKAARRTAAATTRRTYLDAREADGSITDAERAELEALRG